MVQGKKDDLNASILHWYMVTLTNVRLIVMCCVYYSKIDKTVPLI